MPRTLTVTLDDDTADLVERQLASGLYATPDEVVHAGLAVLREHEWTLEALREEVGKGENGPFAQIDDIDAFFEDVWDRSRREA